VQLSHFAAEAGARALVLAPPYYFPNSQPELLEYVQHLAPELPLPLFLYNMPTHTKTIFDRVRSKCTRADKRPVRRKTSSSPSRSTNSTCSASGTRRAVCALHNPGTPNFGTIESRSN